MGSSERAFVNEHCAYGELSKPDRRALRGVISSAFPLGKSAHDLWSDFTDTTAFVRRMREPSTDGPPEGIVAGAIVMSYPVEQYDYLAYIAVLPELRRRRRLLRTSERPRHGTRLLHHVYDVMRNRVDASRLQQYLMIEPAGKEALNFYRKALPTNEYPVTSYDDGSVFLVAYDGLAL